MKDIASSDFPVYAHIYNRGVDRRTIFQSVGDYSRFMLTMRVVALSDTSAVSTLLRMREKQLITSIKQKNLEQQFGPLIVRIISFCQMPNHYHIVLKSDSMNAISMYASRLANSYTRFFNTKHDRKGRLFESSYKLVQVKTDEQLVHVVRYVHTNPSNSTKLNLNEKQLQNYMWSSLPAYLKGKSKMCDIDEVLSHFSSIVDFWEFTKAGIKHSENLSEDLLIDSDDE